MLKWALKSLSISLRVCRKKFRNECKSRQSFHEKTEESGENEWFERVETAQLCLSSDSTIKVHRLLIHSTLDCMSKRETSRYLYAGFSYVLVPIQHKATLGTATWVSGYLNYLEFQRFLNTLARIPDTYYSSLTLKSSSVRRSSYRLRISSSWYRAHWCYGTTPERISVKVRTECFFSAEEGEASITQRIESAKPGQLCL